MLENEGKAYYWKVEFFPDETAKQYEIFGRLTSTDPDPRFTTGRSDAAEQALEEASNLIASDRRFVKCFYIQERTKTRYGSTTLPSYEPPLIHFHVYENGIVDQGYGDKLAKSILTNLQEKYNVR